MTAEGPRAPGLDELRRELEALGMVVAPFRDRIHVRRSTLEYISVRIDNGVLRCEPYVGVMSLARTTWVLLAVEAIGSNLMFKFGPTSVALTAAFTGLLIFGFHALRYTLAEIAISRIESVWRNLRDRQRLWPESSPMSLPSPATRELSSGPVSATQQAGSPAVT